jgi:ribosomal-protein-alanine N-acetyltransferase
MTHTLRALTPSDAAAAAAVHALGFADPWSEAGFAAQFADPAAITLGHVEDGALIAFALFREVAGEADLLTVATHPDRRSQGLARALLSALAQTLAARGVGRLTLDVAEDNIAARHLYASLGFTDDGRRPRYYTAGRAVPVDAVLMSKPLAG